MRVHTPLVATAIGLVAGGLLTVLVTPPKRAGADTPTIAVAAVKPGMKGYGLTVFSGTQPEKFDVEVIDVLHKFRPNQDLILIKTIHPRLEKVKVVAGMSGSPIFLNDGGTAKLAGAYAYGWAFGNEPVAGVTPIETMMKELDRPLSPMLLKPGKPPIGPVPPAKKGAALDKLDPAEKPATAWRGDVGSWSLKDHVAQVASRVRGGAGLTPAGSPSPVDTPLVVGGMSERAIREMTTMLAPLGLVPLQAGGAGVAVAKDAPLHYVDGGAIAVQLMRGDSAAQATGTVTHVLGNKLLGFGHPMMEVGRTHLPTAIAKVLWVLSSEQRSFKIGEPARPLGALTQDRESCIVVDEDMAAPMIPVSVDLIGDPTAPKKKWSMEIVHDRFLTPMWAAFAFGDAVSVTVNDRTDASWKLVSTVKLKGKGTMNLEDFGVSGGGIPGGAAFFVSRAGKAVAELMNNPWEPVVIEKIESTLTVDWKRDTVLLRGAELLDLAVEPGASARVKLTLKPYYGAEFTKIVSVKIDPILAGKDIDLEISPGWMVFEEGAAPESVDQLIKNLQLPTLGPKSFVIQYKHPESGVAYNGKVASKLPTFALDALKPTTGTIQPESIPSYVRATIDVGGYTDGTSRLKLTVKPAVK